jgi:hypothetical protein
LNYEADKLINKKEGNNRSRGMPNGVKYECNSAIMVAQKICQKLIKEYYAPIIGSASQH